MPHDPRHGSRDVTLTFYDAAFPPASPPETDGVAFYIGGDTPHIWTRAEVGASPARYRLPVYVRSDPARASATADMTAAVTRLHQLGAPRGTVAALDLETAADPVYVRAAWRALRGDGYLLMVYASQRVVLSEGNPDGLYWGADWTSRPHLASRDAMTQWEALGPYDESVARSGLPFWDTRPPRPLTWEEKLMSTLPQVAAGAAGNMVRTVQGLCCARDRDTAIDGDFGPATEAAVKAVQAAAGITADGIVGPQTWPVLIGTGS